jgi:hypothetical protein
VSTALAVPCFRVHTVAWVGSTSVLKQWVYIIQRYLCYLYFGTISDEWDYFHSALYRLALASTFLTGKFYVNAICYEIFTFNSFNKSKQ